MSALLLLASTAARAQSEDGGVWTLEASGPITVRTRPLAGTAVREVLAEADLDARPFDVQEAVLSTARYPNFMPRVKVARSLGDFDAGGERLVYTRVSLPFVSDRDFVLRDRLVRGLEPDGTGEFISTWEALPDALPEQADAVRVRLNSGRWHVTPGPQTGTSHVVYWSVADPGGNVPSFVAEKANCTGVLEILRAIEREAQRVATDRVRR